MKDTINVSLNRVELEILLRGMDTQIHNKMPFPEGFTPETLVTKLEETHEELMIQIHNESKCGYCGGTGELQCVGICVEDHSIPCEQCGGTGVNE